MNRTPVLVLSGLAAGAALAATLASLGGTASSGAAHPAVSRVAVVRRISQRQVCQAVPSACAPSRSGNGAPAASPPARPSQTSHASGRLADGLYTDAADGTPHYVIALGVSGNGNISGSVTFLYQDGRTQTIGRYTGKLSGGGRLRMIFAGGKALVGTYGTGQLTLTGCTSVLTWAVRPAGCRFTYHGHVP